MLSCATLKSHKKKITCNSTYKITSVTKMDSEKPQVVCFVYDRTIGGNGQLPCASVKFYGGIDLERLTDLDGYIKLEIPTGKYKIQVAYMGFLTIETNYINLKPYTKTEIRFDLEEELQDTDESHYLWGRKKEKIFQNDTIK